MLRASSARIYAMNVQLFPGVMPMGPPSPGIVECQSQNGARDRTSSARRATNTLDANFRSPRRKDQGDHLGRTQNGRNVGENGNRQRDHK